MDIVPCAVVQIYQHFGGKLLPADSTLKLEAAGSLKMLVSLQ